MALVLLLAALAWAQGFGEPSSGFGDSQTQRDFSAPALDEESASASAPYFIHDQLIKLLLVLAFSLASLVIIWTRRFALRRWLLVLSVVVLGFVLGGVLCPISAVQNIILKISTGYLLLFLIPTVMAVLVGRVFCGYVCPFGALQELVHVRRWRLAISERWMKGLRWIPFLLLGVLVLRALSTGLLTWSGFTPFKAFFAWGGTTLTYAISGLFVIASIVVFRPFCRLLCPLGAWLGLVARISPLRIRESARCVSCSRCNTACASAAVSNGDVRAVDCLLCGECIRICPTEALSVCGRHSRTTD